MSGVHRLFRDRVKWRRLLDEPRFPGDRPLGPPERLLARDAGLKFMQVSGDTVHRRVWWVLPGEEVRPGDEINGAIVHEVADARDTSGRLIYRVCYAEI